MAGLYTYIRDPDAIYALSFERVRAAVELARFPEDVAEIVLRVVHSCGMPEIAEDIIYSEDVARRAVAALRRGAPIIADCAMVASGITRRFLPAQNEIIMTLKDGDIPSKAKALGTTRSAAAVESWPPFLDGAVVAIGNAPTALFHLLERLDEGWPAPAVIFAFPVGFVGAAESKAALAANPPLNSAFMCLSGTRGGSAMASAAINAAALLAGRDA
ncbi:precorrin-8X methylmutase [Alphaproteobacteria bacterium LSUCC0684]